MRRKTVVLMFFVFLGVLVGDALAAFDQDTNWTGVVSDDWFTTGNWDIRVPGSADRAVIDDPVSGYALVVNEAVSAEALQFGFNASSTSTASVTTGGSITLSQFLTMAQGVGANVVFTMEGGSISTGGNMSVGYTSGAVFTITGGTVTISGTLRIGVSSGSNGHVNLDGGAISAGNLSMRENGGIGTIDISGGTLILSGQWNESSSGFTSGWVTAYDGAGVLEFAYDVGTNKTTITATLQSYASQPSPYNGQTDVAPSAILGWRPGTGAIAHDVYFGTDYTDVNTASDPNVLPGRGRQDFNSFDPCGLELGETYYWRIDEFDGSSTTKGIVWEFTVTDIDPRYASNPSPGDGASGVSVDADLSWSAGVGAIDHYVYFGTDFNDVNDSVVPDANTATTSYDTGVLDFSTTYYWRIDEDDSGAVYKGGVWEFTTRAMPGTPAFPGAEGAGKWTVGGRGGTVYEVSSLADYNDSETPIAGSLRAAIEAEGSRIVVFRISGTIHLKTKLMVTNPYITIAGQTAPGDGICIARHPVWVETDHVIIRHIRFRLSDEGVNDPGYTGPEGYDSLSVNEGKNIMIDHCSASWSIDESLSTSVQDRNSDVLGKLTVQWCMIAESLNCAAHNSPTCHGYGTLAKGGWGNEYTYHHNLYAHHVNRNPYPGNYNDISVDPEGLTFDFRNNVIYNWGGTFAGYNTQNGANSVTKMNFVSNYYKTGPESDGSLAFYEAVLASKGYFSGNWMNSDYPADPWSLVIYNGWTSTQINAYKQSSELPVSESIPAEDAETAYVRVLVGAGATLPARDSVDERIVNDVINGTGEIIDDEDEVGGWPVLVSTTPPVDSDHDGMPDAWEIARGLNASNSSDSSGDRDGDGYTNVEEYLNYLTLSHDGTAGDYDVDDDVDLENFAAFINDWLVEDCIYVPAGDMDSDCDVDWEDFAIFAKNWTG